MTYCFNKSLFEKYKNELTPNNNSLRNIITAALENKDKKYGVYASDEYCYTQFSDFYHNIFENLGHDISQFIYQKSFLNVKEKNYSLLGV